MYSTDTESSWRTFSCIVSCYCFSLPIPPVEPSSLPQPPVRRRTAVNPKAKYIFFIHTSHAGESGSHRTHNGLILLHILYLCDLLYTYNILQADKYQPHKNQNMHRQKPLWSQYKDSLHKGFICFILYEYFYFFLQHTALSMPPKSLMISKESNSPVSSIILWTISAWWMPTSIAKNPPDFRWFPALAASRR